MFVLDIYHIYYIFFIYIYCIYFLATLAIRGGKFFADGAAPVNLLPPHPPRPPPQLPPLFVPLLLLPSRGLLLLSFAVFHPYQGLPCAW